MYNYVQYSPHLILLTFWTEMTVASAIKLHFVLHHSKNLNSNGTRSKKNVMEFKGSESSIDSLCLTKKAMIFAYQI